ncbi:MAG: YigZ family protein [Clostridiales Family XIII bacterium]|jgi:uncharacterized YigZ family protein|nr:YigZ family protein [Clostridiales Family XIII bacterium]
MRSWWTVRGRGEAESVVERSRFIGYVSPADSLESCEAFFAEIRRAHHGARHNVPAYRLRAGDAGWASDDGEPSGTAGAPILSMLEKEGVRDVALVVTRYFGGVKLGPGGLVRAYTQAAKDALAAAGLCRMRERLLVAFETDYAGYGAVSGDKNLRVENAVFAETVRAELVCDGGGSGGGGREAAVKALLARAPGAQLHGERVVAVPDEDAQAGRAL